ncbi:M28 family peptidase [Cystobacter fuscus]|uniref:M28 family peptidase n=1 Tax=Cystobacter fuscus TaxID=43 RepID=UPI0037BE78AA
MKQPSAAVKTWTLILAVAALVLGLVRASYRLPSPRGPDTPADSFSEARAWPVLRELARGPRVAGTPEQERAAEYLAEQLRAIPGLEVRVQRAEGTWFNGWTTVDYRALNVLARLPGELPGEAVLLGAHHDSSYLGVGAGDNALAVAAAVEVMRALAAGPRPTRTVLLGLNGAEEAGLVGAAGLLQHPWARQAKVFLNLDAAGPRGPSILFRASPAQPWLLEAYARAAPHPLGSVIGQDIIEAVPSDTDFRVFTEHGLPGLDIALFQDGYAYHTPLDRLERLEPGSLQHMGDNTLALVRELARGPRPGEEGAGPSTYYDVLGVGMIAHGRAAALALLGLSGLLVLAALAGAWRSAGVSPGKMLGALGGVLLAVGLALLPPVLGALLLGFGLGRPHGWYATPWLGVATFGALALCGLLGARALAERHRSGEAPGSRRVALARASGVLLFWLLVSSALMAGGLGVAYVGPWWILPGAVALLVACRRPRLARVTLVLACLPGLLVTTQAVAPLLELFVPVAGRLMAGFPLDAAIALLVALPTALTALPLWVAVEAPIRPGFVATGLAVLGVAGLGALALTPPYTPERPRRLILTHVEHEEHSELELEAEDGLGLGEDVPGLSARERRSATVRLPAATPDAPPLPLSVEVVDSEAARWTATVRWRGAPGASLTLRLPRESIAGWTLSSGPSTPEGTGPEVAMRVVTPPSGEWTGHLELRGDSPVTLQVRELHPGRATPETTALRRRLPAWVTLEEDFVRVRRLSLQPVTR